jgi:hypothetical protein
MILLFCFSDSWQFGNISLMFIATKHFHHSVQIIFQFQHLRSQKLNNCTLLFFGECGNEAAMLTLLVGNITQRENEK